MGFDGAAYRFMRRASWAGERRAAISWRPSCRNPPFKVAEGVPRADCKRPRPLMPGRHPYRSIQSAWSAINLVEHQEDDLHESASRLKTPPYCQPSCPPPVADRVITDHIAVGGHLERRVRLRLLVDPRRHAPSADGEA